MDGLTSDVTNALRSLLHVAMQGDAVAWRAWARDDVAPLYVSLYLAAVSVGLAARRVLR